MTILPAITVPVTLLSLWHSQSHTYPSPNLNNSVVLEDFLNHQAFWHIMKALCVFVVTKL